MSKLLIVVVAVLASGGMAFAATLQVASTTIANAPGQEVLILGRGPEQVGGVNLRIQIGDGGELVGGTDVPAPMAGATVAGIETIDFRRNNSIWGSDTALVEDPGIVTPLLTFGGFGLQSGSKQLPNEGSGGAVIATLVLDGTGLPLTTFNIALEAADTPSDFGGIPTELVTGVITVIPEPASALLLLGALPFMRRRRA